MQELLDTHCVHSPDHGHRDCDKDATNYQAAKCKWRALRHTCLLLLSVLGGMPASHQGMQARLFFVVDI